MNWIKKIIHWHKHLRDNDPLYSCEVYKDKKNGSCSHIDGCLCDMKTCNILADYRDNTHKDEVEIGFYIEDLQKENIECLFSIRVSDGITTVTAMPEKAQSHEEAEEVRKLLWKINDVIQKRSCDNASEIKD